jgi:hypothetical protein
MAAFDEVSVPGRRPCHATRESQVLARRFHTIRGVGELSPKTGRWIAPPKKARWVAPAAIFILFSQLPNLFNTVFNAGRHSYIVSYILAAVFSVLALVLLTIALRTKFAARLRLKDKELAENAFGDQYLVEITIGSEQNRLGTDRGILWFSEGLMGFSGDATSFVLAAWDVEVPPKNGRHRDQKLPLHSIALVDSPVPGYFVIHPLNRDAAEYRKRLERFERESADFDAERTWPPLEPYAEHRALVS